MLDVSYVAFLKLKQNEVKAVSVLYDNGEENCRPFFDIPRLDSETDESLRKKIATCYKTIKVAQEKKEFPFFLDSYDISEDIQIDGVEPYEYILDQFGAFNLYPVVGLDRSIGHNNAVVDRLERYDCVGVRLQNDDLATPRITVEELKELTEPLKQVEVYLIIDCRVIDKDYSTDKLEAFIEKVKKSDLGFEAIIVTASSIPKSIGELLKVNESKTFKRYEWKVWEKVKGLGVIYGDYSVVSPDYSDADIAPNLMYDVQTPKILYTDHDTFFGARGAGLRSKGNEQYYKLAEEVTKLPFFRTAQYSPAEGYIENVVARKNLQYRRHQGKVPTCGSASKWIEITTMAHLFHLSRVLL